MMRHTLGSLVLRAGPDILGLSGRLVSDAVWNKIVDEARFNVKDRDLPKARPL